MAYNAPTTEVDPVHVLAQAGWPEPRSLQRIEGGWITLIWRFETADGKVHGLRLYRPADGIDEQARRESLTIQALLGAGLPAPELEASGVYDGCPYFIMSWLRGKQLVQIMEKQLWRLWPLALEFGRLQARLHRLAPEGLRYRTPAGPRSRASPSSPPRSKRPPARTPSATSTTTPSTSSRMLRASPASSTSHRPASPTAAPTSAAPSRC